MGVRKVGLDLWRGTLPAPHESGTDGNEEMKKDGRKDVSSTLSSSASAGIGKKKGKGMYGIK
jgi:hypothetical protein